MLVLCRAEVWITCGAHAQLCKVARAHGAAFVQCFLSCPAEVAAARNAARPAACRVPDHSLQRMAQVMRSFLLPNELFQCEASHSPLRHGFAPCSAILW